MATFATSKLPSSSLLPIEQKNGEEDHMDSNFRKLIVELNVSEIRIQQNQNRLNLSPNESKSRTRSVRLDETNPTSIRTLNSDITKSVKCLINDPRSRESTSTVHPNHSQLTIDLPPIYKSCHSRKSINRASISHEKGPKPKEEKSEIALASSLLLDHRPEYCRTTASCRSSAGPPPDAGVPPDHLPTPNFPQTTG
ncbi:hypothetical protein M5K25_015313 [Dendrobium thyrsiflorum]|uniref:Uncharacterized protein n=1 Tax=Dendrobium thyrsiflorum TaxID=117978 RepID=A0ABD0UXV6_DENTH